MASKETLDLLYPLPSSLELSPMHLPGFSPASAEALVGLLKENYCRFHIFFNDIGLHNHLSHHLFANFALGASKGNLEGAFNYQANTQRPAFDSPSDISESNWIDHLGDERYYQAYYKFFATKVLKDGMDVTLEKCVFSNDANWIGRLQEGKQPYMLNRFFSGVLHPLIHAGYALEFGSPGMLVEGLAMACVTRGTDFDPIIPKSIFGQSVAAGKVLSSLPSALSLPNPTSPGTHSFNIISRMMADPELAPGVACEPVPVVRRSDNGGPIAPLPLRKVFERVGDLIKKYASEWVVDANDKEDVTAKTEEVFVLVTLLYGVAGLQAGKDFKADFFSMHLITSSLFLPSYLSYLKPSSQTLLLQTYFACVLSVWVARGRPAPHISQFYTRTEPRFSVYGPVPKPGPDALAPEDAIAPNPWLFALQSTLVHPDEHLAKCMRALAYFAQVLGAKPAGTWAGRGLPGDEVLDGTVFVRAASLTMDYLGWVREGAEKKGVFDFSGFWD